MPHDEAQGRPSSELELRRFAAEDEAAVLRLLGGSFESWSGQVGGIDLGNFFRWKHLESPFGPSILIVAVAGGELAGFLAYMPWRLRAGDHTLSTMRGVDLAVNPSHRRRGVAVALIRAGHERYIPRDVSFAWNNPNAASRSRVREAGLVGVDRLSAFTRPHLPLRIRRLWGRSSPSGPPAVEAATAAETLAADIDLPGAGASSPHGRVRLRTAIDLEFLRWRYGRFPVYHAVVARDRRGAHGIAVFRPHRYERFSVCHVSELVTAPGDARAARKLVAMVRGASRWDSVVCRFPSRLEAARCGFVPASGGAALSIGSLKPGTSPDPRQRSSWALSLGDLELV